MVINTDIRRIIAGLFLTLFSVYYANATLFEHCHVINGVTIVHSHFHAESHHSTPAGGHTETSLTLIASLDNIECLGAGDILCFLAAYTFLCGVVGAVPVRESAAVYVIRHFLRAPPALQ